MATRLPASTRERIVQLYLEGHSYSDIARELGISRNTVAKRVHFEGIKCRGGERRPPLDTETKELIIDLKRKGWTHKQVKQALEVAMSTIVRVLSEHKATV